MYRYIYGFLCIVSMPDGTPSNALCLSALTEHGVNVYTKATCGRGGTKAVTVFVHATIVLHTPTNLNNCMIRPCRVVRVVTNSIARKSIKSKWYSKQYKNAYK